MENQPDINNNVPMPSDEHNSAPIQTPQSFQNQFQPAKKLKPRINFKVLSIVLGALLIVSLGVQVYMWQKWNSSQSSRKISITGKTTLKAEPDEFEFMPSYEFATNAETSKKGTEVVNKLKELGVTDAQIKTDLSRYPTYSGPSVQSSDKETSTLMLTITVADKDLAQKIQDYLLTTNSSGLITPYPSFSSKKQKELENKARDDAIKDARENAEKTAANLKAKVGKVIEIKDSENTGIMPMYSDTTLMSGSNSLKVQPGEQDYDYSILVTFELK